MSEHPNFDPNRGFVALPVEVMDLDLSPGAFRLLAELCRMANRDGFCWPSLGQLSERLGRSKSAISGYLTDLRDADLVETITQTTANGYNYRLKYRVTFWAAWRETLGKSRPRPERRVQPVERKCDSQKHKHKNHTPCGGVSKYSDLALQWANCFRGAPYPSVQVPPDPGLVMATENAVQSGAATTISGDISEQLAAFWHGKSVPISAENLRLQADILRKKRLTEAELSDILGHLAKCWKPHWRNPPTADQFAQMVASARIDSQDQVLSLLQSYLRRWHMAQSTSALCSQRKPAKKTWRSCETAGIVGQNISVDIDNGIRAV